MNENKEDLFHEVIEKVNKDTFFALERLLPKKKSNFLQKICLHKKNTTNDFLKIDERAYRALSLPLWEILSRKGKGWRSYVLQVSCEAIGYNFLEYQDWLALPEIIHVGSLIIDDIQDSSEVRRGDSACHLIYGIGAAINAGAFAYFIGQNLIERTVFDKRKKLALYQEYMSLLREAHIGQGLDIEGLKLVLKDSISDPDKVSNAVMDIHRRKSGIAFGTFARMGAILGCGTATQINVLGRFFEEIGTLYQIRDDIINITGFGDNLKQQFEDLENGKITLPLALAIQNLTEYDRKLIFEQLCAKTHDAETLKDKLLDAIESTSSIRMCEDLIKKNYRFALEAFLKRKCNFFNIENIEMFSKRMLDFPY